MLRPFFLSIVIAIWWSHVIAKKETSKTVDLEENREIEILDLIRILEDSINAAIDLNDDGKSETREIVEIVPETDRKKEIIPEVQQVRQNTPQHPAYPNSKDGRFGNTPQILQDDDLQEVERVSDKSKPTNEDSQPQSNQERSDQNSTLEKLKRGINSLQAERALLLKERSRPNELSDLQKDERYYRALLRLRNLYSLYEKYLELDDDYLGSEEYPLDLFEDERQARTTGDHWERKIKKLREAKLRHLEKKRLLTERIAEKALALSRQKSRSNPSTVRKPSTPITTSSDKKRDVASSNRKNVDIQTTPDIKPKITKGSQENYERKTKMDSALQNAVSMINKLAHETLSRAASSDEDSDERDKTLLGLAIDLVNTVTLGTSSDKQLKGYDPDGKFVHKNVDDYLGATAADQAGLDVELELSNSGFDYVGHGDEYDGYVGHPSPFSRGSCDTCAKFDMILGDTCPACKSGEEPVFTGRKKRKPLQGLDARGKIYHLDRSRNAIKSGGAWEDVNKLYNFEDLENDKFIDLSKNCTNSSGNAECERLDFELVTPGEGKPVPLSFVKDNLNHGRDLALDMRDRARGLQDKPGRKPAPNSPSQLHFLHQRADEPSIKLNEESQLVLFGMKVLQQKLISEYNMTPNTFVEFLRHHGFRVTGSQICRSRQKRCNTTSKFRTIEGSCNNVRNPSWGKSYTAFARLLPARYSDGIHAMPLSVSGRLLPNPRLLSTQLLSRRDAPDPQFTLALAQWGQLLAHDFARQMMDQTAEGGIECCEPSGRGTLPKPQQHHSCMPITVANHDLFYSKYNVSCMNFVRSMTVAREDCSLGPADQLNGVSSFLDLSPVYGADQAASESLREFRGGRMRTESRANRIMMPTSPKSGFCDARDTDDICYQTGDVRTNQNPQLVILHTLIIREHNRIAHELAALNPHWDDERLFQESRTIVIAEYQHITYRHWLPLVLGQRYYEERKIFTSHEGLSNDYDVNINPTTINGFTSGAFRFLHSLIEGHINLVADNYATTEVFRLSDYYFRPHIVETNSNFESLLRGLVTQTMQKSDVNFDKEVTEYLFRSASRYGMDLESLDIQRGRDHGIPSYNSYRELCNLGRAHGFHDLINEVSLNHIEKLQTYYEHVDDIDLIVGATLETKLPGTLLGPTLQCLIGEQFYRSRVGDKYFYNNAHFAHSFSIEQYEEIKKASLATLICDLGEAVYAVQQFPFQISSNRNPAIPCFNLPRVDLEFWKEETHEIN
ncbi:hypothetical protein QAD02_011865 [Eretmocerus hayati]|uniref:Uncharacterized protein n=1 Tax=Eretmocerus hayati TaxID=131215 RepID=A0ACC2NYC5_9HYME|nr:hypothetical protein QAD02_011865 [Eretmocerus hayati]